MNEHGTTLQREGTFSGLSEAERLQREQIKLLYAQAPAGLLATLVNSLVLTLVLWQVTPYWKLLLWLVLVLLGAWLTHRLIKSYRNAPAEEMHDSRWSLFFLIGLGTCGCLMGLAGIFLFPYESLAHALFLAFLLGGMVAGATGTYSVMMRAFLIYTLPIITPLCFQLLRRGSELEVAIGGLLVVFYGIMLHTAYYVHRTTIQSLRLRFENSGLLAELMVSQSRSEQAIATLQHEIAERKNVERALRESEEKYRMIFENSPLGIVHFERDGTITAYNENLADMSDTSREEFIGLNPLTYLQDEELKGAIAACLKGERAHYAGCYRSRRTGRVTPIKADFSPIVGDQGVVLGGTGIIQNISEQKRVEKKLEDQLHFLQTLIDTIPNPIFYKDTGGIYVGCNRAFEIRLGLDRRQIVGKTVYDLLPRDLADEYHRMDLALLRNPGEQVYETSLVYSDGQRRDIILNKATYFNVEGELAGLVGVSVDITDRKRAEAALKRAHDELEQRVQERTSALAAAVEELQNEIAERRKAEEALRNSSEKLKLFAYSVIHDLKSPAIGIYGVANLLSKRYENALDEKGRMYCDQILKASEHVALLVEQINVYMAAKEAPVVIEKINVNDILQMVYDEFSAQFSLRRVQWFGLQERVQIHADRLCIHRVFRNLVDNALKYGGEKLSEIRIGYREERDFFVFSVTDNGIGVSKEDSERIFGIFERDKAARGISGTGLGLAIVKEISEKHGGDVWIEPGVDGGTTFYVSIAKHPGAVAPA
ncbi:sensor histidine kinase [Desulfoferrobacter suflitae]|uniref:sensor histidine kinase n=1 Tax=Desulfoferrobacter suflitae TaxID=2865782 RepID=UPI0021648EC4|nr:PAS domain-containing sensor histidine kinase [Desulfoferrobacter suflitae]MCK8601600.1 PAS domain S-box protein [Desulfoferrobacter suflitae]